MTDQGFENRTKLSFFIKYCHINHPGGISKNLDKILNQYVKKPVFGDCVEDLLRINPEKYYGHEIENFRRLGLVGEITCSELKKVYDIYINSLFRFPSWTELKIAIEETIYNAFEKYLENTMKK